MNLLLQYNLIDLYTIYIVATPIIIHAIFNESHKKFFVPKINANKEIIYVIPGIICADITPCIVIFPSFKNVIPLSI